jgi:hypothetical protein
LLDSFPQLRTLRCARVAPDCLPLLAANSCSLTGLHLSDESLHLQDLINTGAVQRLTDISVARATSYAGTDFRANIFLQPFGNCPALLRVTFHWIDVKDLITVMQHTPSLRHLQVTGIAVNLTGPAFFDAAARFVPHLQSLQITKCTNALSRSSTVTHAMEQAALAMVLQLRDLRELKLGGYHELAKVDAREFDLRQSATNITMRSLVLGRVFHYDCIGALLKVSYIRIAF